MSDQHGCSSSDAAEPSFIIELESERKESSFVGTPTFLAFSFSVSAFALFCNLNLA